MPAYPVYQFDAAIVRTPPQSVVNGLRAGGGEGPSYASVKAEHDAYVAALRDAGVEVSVLPALESYPDSLFVEDPALVFPEGAILLRGAADTRAGEAAEIESVLRDQFDKVLALRDGYVDGGDVLLTQDKVMIGLSARTDEAGAKNLQARLEELGCNSEIVETPAGVLHFKTDCSLLNEETILTTARLAQSGVFDGFDQLLTPEGEEAAANALRVNDVVFVGAGFPKTIKLIEDCGFSVVPLETSEIGKIDAGLSCMSLRWRRRSP